MLKLRNALGVAACAATLPFLVAGTADAAPREAVNGRATYYTDAGFGACGTRINASTELLVAAPAGLFTSPNPNNDPLCRKSIRVRYNGRTITVPIKDKCPSCDNSKIDLSLPAFRQLADPNVGIISVSWDIV